MRSLLYADQDLLDDDLLIKKCVRSSVNKLWGTELEYGALDTSDPAQLIDQYVQDAYPPEEGTNTGEGLGKGDQG